MAEIATFHDLISEHKMNVFVTKKCGSEEGTKLQGKYNQVGSCNTSSIPIGTCILAIKKHKPTFIVIT